MVMDTLAPFFKPGWLQSSAILVKSPKEECKEALFLKLKAHWQEATKFFKQSMIP